MLSIRDKLVETKAIIERKIEGSITYFEYMKCLFISL